MLRIIFSTDKLSFLPILIFDKNILNEKVLLAIDDPESSMRAVDFLTTPYPDLISRLETDRYG